VEEIGVEPLEPKPEILNVMILNPFSCVQKQDLEEQNRHILVIIH